MATPDEPAPKTLSRRALLGFTLGAFVVATMPRAKGPARRHRSRTVPTMGTLARVTVVDADERRGNAALDAAVAELLRVDRLMTRFDDASDVGRANLGAARGPVAVTAETAAVVEASLRWADASDGSFDPSLERAIDLWDVLHRREPPEAALVRRYAGRRLWRRVDVDAFSGGHAIRFGDSDAGLDLGGIAKGHAVDCAVHAIRAVGVRDALVVAGGDLAAIGHAESGAPWRVGIRSPYDPDGIVGEIDVVDAAVATSGDYERYFEWRGARYAHILDTETGAPRQAAVHGVTVCAPTCLEADAAATAVFGKPREWADRLLARCAPGARLVATA